MSCNWSCAVCLCFRNVFPQVRMPHREVIVCFMIFPVGVQGSVMQKTHVSSRATPKVRHRLLSREVYRTIVLLSRFGFTKKQKHAKLPKSELPLKKIACSPLFIFFNPTIVCRTNPKVGRRNSSLIRKYNHLTPFL